MEMNASEPLMTCRKRLDDVEMGVSHCTPRQARRKPWYCPCGTRWRRGMNILQAQAWNVRTCRFDVKRESRVVKSHKCKSSEAEHRDGVTRSSEEASVMEVERRGYPIQLELLEQLATGGSW
jgi:hypothetical protein